MKLRNISYYLGRVFTVGAVIMMIPIIVSVIYRDRCARWFLLSSLILGVTGLLMTLWGRKKKTSLTGREGMALVALSWIFLSVVGALPSVFSGAVPSFTDAFFDTVSGYTTTGATVLSSMEALPKSILFWRAFTHWVGGLGILVFAVAVLPRDKHINTDGSASETYAIRAESPGPTFGKLVSKLRFNSQILYLIYLGLTVLEVILLSCGKMPVFDSICNSMATMGSGGFATTTSSIVGYGPYIQWVIGVFMVFAGLNFNFYYFLLIRKFTKALKMDEVRWYIAIIIIATASVSLNIYHLYGNFGDSVRNAFFQVASIISTTGFSTANFDVWPEFSKMVLVLLMFIGGCAGSTGGGIKVSRIVVLLKTGIKELRYYINNREVRAVHFDGEAIDRSVMTGISAYFIVYMFVFASSVLAVSCIDGHDFTTSFTSVAACFNNIGPGLSEVGPASNFACMSTASKYILSFDMLLGRLEMFPILVLLSPTAWKRR